MIIFPCFMSLPQIHFQVFPEGAARTFCGCSLRSSRERILGYRFSQPQKSLVEAQWCDEIVEVLREAVQLRLISEVPLGPFCQGIDSSSVVALMSQISGAGNHHVNWISEKTEY